MNLPQGARQAFESLDHEALAALGLGPGTNAPPTAHERRRRVSVRRLAGAGGRAVLSKLLGRTITYQGVELHQTSADLGGDGGTTAQAVASALARHQLSR